MINLTRNARTADAPAIAGLVEILDHDERNAGLKQVHSLGRTGGRRLCHEPAGRA